jgi:hypothetical protein
MKRLLILAPLALAACDIPAAQQVAPLTERAMAMLRLACTLSPEARASIASGLGATDEQAAAACEIVKG